MTDEPSESEDATGRSMTEAQHDVLDRIAEAFEDRLLASAWVGDRLHVYVKDWTEGTAHDEAGIEVRPCPRSMNDLEAAQEAADPVYERLFTSGVLDHVSLQVPAATWRLQLRRQPTPDEAVAIAQLTSTGAFDVVVVEDDWTEFRFD